MRITSLVVRPLTAALAAALMLAVLAPMAPRPESGPVEVRAAETTGAVNETRDFDISPDSTHVAIHWSANPDAVVTVSFSKDGKVFSDPSAIDTDDSDDGRDVPTGDETYGDLIGVDGVRTVRVHTDRRIAKLSVLAMNAAGPEPPPLGLGAAADGATTLPAVISRAQWGADESLRFDAAGDEQWPREYFPVQKLVVHHTAGRNADPDPAATVRAIYYYHAVTRRWADIGYNYLIDEQGRVYEGRYARDFWNGATPSSDNDAGLGVAAGHTKDYNQGTMGIALLGTFTSQAPTAAARASLVRMLAWASAKYHINPTASGLYTNPKSGVTGTQPNIAGHRDYASTACPGTVLYSQLPSIRNDVAGQVNNWPSETFNPQRTLSFAAGTYVGRQFSATGVIIASKPYTLTKSSSAPTSERSSVPNQGGNWYYVTAGVWAGYWVPASPAITLSGAPSPPVLEPFDTARPLSIPAGTYVGRKFNTYGEVTSSKPYTLSTGSTAWTTQKSTIPNQTGNWYYVTVGVWEGYWIPEVAGMTLGAPPPPLPVPIAIFNPPRTLTLAPGTYVGRRFSAYGISAGTWTATLIASSSAPTSRYSTLPGQTGNWYYIIDGAFESYWILESASTTLSGPPPPPPPPPSGTTTYNPPAALVFKQGAHTGYQFDASGTVTGQLSFTLGNDSGASTSTRSPIANHSGYWFYVTNGIWAGLWVQESSTVYLPYAPPAPPSGTTTYNPPAALVFKQGAHTGYQFDASGTVTGQLSFTLGNDSGANTSTRSPIANHSGYWFYVTNGIWAGLWVQESSLLFLASG